MDYLTSLHAKFSHRRKNILYSCEKQASQVDLLDQLDLPLCGYLTTVPSAAIVSLQRKDGTARRRCRGQKPEPVGRREGFADCPLGSHRPTRSREGRRPKRVGVDGSP